MQVNASKRVRNDVAMGATYWYLSSASEVALIRKAKNLVKDFGGSNFKFYDFDVETKLTNRGTIRPINFKMTVKLV